MTEFDLVIANGTVVNSTGRRQADIGVRAGQVAAIEPRGTLIGTAIEEIDANGQYVLPGLIDAHVHFREPGLEHEETWLTGTRAAVMGGVTTVLDMPNTVPPTDTVKRARDKLALAARSAYCDFGIFGLIGQAIGPLPELAASGLVVGLKVFMGPTTGDLRAPDPEGLRRALEIAEFTGLRTAFHAESREPIERAEASLRRNGRTDALAHLDARFDLAEVGAVLEVWAALMSTRAMGHILHLSSAKSLGVVESAREAQVELTCEVTPHHLFLDRDVYDTAGGVARVN